MSPTDLLNLATRFDGGGVVHLNGMIMPKDFSGHRYTIELRPSGKHGHKWTICNNGFCLSKISGAFEYEGMSSVRPENFIVDTRFDTVEEAFAFLETWRIFELERVRALGYQDWQSQTPAVEGVK